MERDRVRGLILRAPAFMIPRGAREGSLLGQDFDPEHIPDVIPVIKGLTLSGNYLREAQAISAEDAADRFRGPVLILQGDEDDLVPPEEVKWMADRYENCDLVLLHGETHHFDKHPEEMYSHIRTWLEKQK